MPGSARRSSYDAWARGMCRSLAASRALAWSREAMAVISEYSPCCMAGITLVVAILATPRMPQRILCTGLFYLTVAPRRSHECERGTQECVRHDAGGVLFHELFQGCAGCADGAGERNFCEIVGIDARDDGLIGVRHRLLGLHYFDVVGNSGGEAIAGLGQGLIREIEVAPGHGDQVGGG